MTKAFLVVGAGLKFLEEANRLEEFLKSSVGISEVKLCLPAYFSRDRLEKNIAEFFDEASSEDTLLIAYMGHGNLQGWAYSSDGSKLPPQALIDVIKQVRARVLVVHACCYSYALAELMAKNEISPERCGVIANGHGATNYNLIGALLLAWSKRQTYQPPNCRERVLLILEMPPLPWREQLREWYLRKYSELQNILLPYRRPVIYGGYIQDLGSSREVILPSRTYEPSDPANPFPARWGAELDHLFFGSDLLPGLKPGASGRRVSRKRDRTR